MLSALVLAASLAAPPPVCRDVQQPFIGTICSPARAGKSPALVLLGGSEGGNSMKSVAQRMAERGYVAASVAYFGLPGLPPYLVNVPVETVKWAIDALQSRPDVYRDRIGIMGISRGGEFALLAASVYPQIKAVVAVVPSPIAYMGLGDNNIPTGCAWTAAGKILPCVPPDPGAGQKIGQEFMMHQPIVLTPLYDASRNADPKVTAASFFQLERIHGPVLCLGAKDDAMWNSSAHCELAASYLREHRHPYADRAIAYPNAGHTFLAAIRGPKFAVTSVTEGGVTMAFGGTADGDTLAARSAMAEINAFLDKNLRDAR